MKYIVKKITANSHLIEFCEGYKNAFSKKNIVSESFLNPNQLKMFGNVFAIFHGKKIVGGYILNNNTECFRSFEGLDKNEKAEILKKFENQTLVEFSSLWRNSNFNNFSLAWAHAFTQLFKVNADVIIGTVYKNHPMTSIYFSVGLNILHSPSGENPLLIWSCTKKQMAAMIIKRLSLKILKYFRRGVSNEEYNMQNI